MGDHRHSSFLFFAYGSCMNLDSLSGSLDLDVRSHVVGPARLADHALRFDYPSTTGPLNFCNIVPCRRAEVQGLLYRLPLDTRARLDTREAVHKGRYRAIEVSVVLSTEMRRTALTYEACVTTASEWSPGERYAELLSVGLSHARVDPEYRDALLQKVRSLPLRSLSEPDRP